MSPDKSPPASGDDESSPTSKIDDSSPASGNDGSSSASGDDGSSPASGDDGSSPTRGNDESSPTSKIGESSPTSGTKARKAVLLRLDPAVHDALSKWAADELRSLNSLIEVLLRQALIKSGRTPAGVGPLPRRGRPPIDRE